MENIRKIIVILGLSLLTACGGSSKEEDPVIVTPTLGKPSLSPQLDQALANSATIGIRGGVLNVQANDGTTFTLNVPAGALSEDTLITMTPVPSMSNLPLQEGLISAVDFKPSGLQFTIPATLTALFPAPLPTRATGFNWSGSGNTFGIQLSQISNDRRSVTALIEHFSGFGLGIPGPSQLDAIAADLIALDAQVSTVWSSLGNCSPCTDQQLIDIAANWFNVIVQPRLNEGQQSAVKALVAHKAYFHWEMLYLSLGSPTQLQATHNNGYSQNLENLRFQYARYTRNISALPQGLDCSGDVANWQDWLRIPDEIRVRTSILIPSDASVFSAIAAGESIATPTSCAELNVGFIEPPTSLTDQQTEVELTLRAEIVHPAGSTPIAAQLTMSYGDGANGESTVITDEQTGEASITVERDPEWSSFRVGAAAIEPSLQRDEVFQDYEEVIIGDSALQFKDVLGAKIILPLGTSENLEVYFSVDGLPIVDQVIQFTLDGPGNLSASTANTTLDNGLAKASIQYSTPDYPVIKNLTTTVIATTTYNGQNYQSKIIIPLYWQDIQLQVNTGTQLLNATNGSVEVFGDGPFGIRALITQSGVVTNEDPVPVNDPNDEAVFEASNPFESTLRAEGGACCSPVVTIPVNDFDGVAIAEWLPDFAIDQEDHVVEVRYGNIAASVNLKRVAPPTLNISMRTIPETLLPGEASTVQVYGWGLGTRYWVELTAVGGELDSVAGLSDEFYGHFLTTITPLAGHSCVAIEARVYTESGGQLLGVSQYPLIANVRAVSGASLFLGGSLKVEIDDGTNSVSGGVRPFVSLHNYCDMQNASGPLQSQEGTSTITKAYEGSDVNCLSSSASASVSRDVQFNKNADLSVINVSLNSEASTQVNGFEGCFDPPGNQNSEAYGEKGGFLTLEEPAFVTVSNLSATTSGPSCGGSTVYFAQALPVNDGYGIGFGIELYACMRSDSSGNSGNCTSISPTLPTSFAGVLPAGRYQINAINSADFQNDQSCSANVAIDISVSPAQ